MPYIDGEELRSHIDPRNWRAGDNTPHFAQNPGELNYQITCLLIQYVEDHGRNYTTLNAISGACTEALAEFRRRVIVPYENGKVLENGDVYPIEWSTTE